jgi:aminopeptidase N
MRRWALRESDQGPIYLGYRLGHVRNDTRVFRALVYDKGAAVLHMLRRLLGDDAFFRGIRRFYGDWRFRKAGTEDLRLAMKPESSLASTVLRGLGLWRRAATAEVSYPGAEPPPAPGRNGGDHPPGSTRPVSS